jgi:hypothetical protein
VISNGTEQLRHGGFQSFSKLFQIDKRYAPLASFDTSNVGSIESAQICKFLLDQRSTTFCRHRVLHVGRYQQKRSYAVRQLMQRFDTINSQRLGLAYVLAEKDLAEYSRLLDAVEAVIPTVIQPIVHADALHGQVYAALDDENADWCSAVLAMLN